MNWEIFEEELRKLPLFTSGLRKSLMEGKGRPISCVYGVVKQLNQNYNKTEPFYKKFTWSKLSVEQPHFMPFLQELAEITLPKDFVWTTAIINKNFKILPHKDGKNVGKSYLITLGNFTGGKTCVDYENEIVKYDSKYNPITFDGARYTHWVEPFEGERWSIVFYNQLDLPKDEIQKLLQNTHYFNWYN